MRITREEMEAARARQVAQDMDPNATGDDAPASARSGLSRKAVVAILVLGVLLLGGGGYAAWRVNAGRDQQRRMARGGPGGPGGRGQFAQRMAEELKLTPDQQTKLRAIREEARPKMQALRQNTSLTEDQRRQQMMAIFAEQRTKMEAILTPEQKAKAQQMGGFGRGGFGGPGRGGPGGQGRRGGRGGQGGPGGPPPGGGGLPNPSTGD